jgi:hypothetical protein
MEALSLLSLIPTPGMVGEHGVVPVPQVCYDRDKNSADFIRL